jgi:hypothetical protein
MSLVIAANEGRRVCAIDIGSAYLNAERSDAEGEEVVMEIEPFLVRILSKVAPEVTPYVDKDTGKLYVKLAKALYGTLDAAKLWYDKITGVLQDMGFERNIVDPCVFNKMVNGKQLTILLYVDDLLAMCEQEGPIMEFVQSLKDKFDNDVKYSMERDLSYLGMHLKIEQGRIEISMKSYVEALINEYSITGVAASPAKSNLFSIDKSSKLLSESDRKVFHTIVCKLLYVAKRVRIDILLAVTFLTTRVQIATFQDQEKLMRVLKYLNSLKDITMVIKPNEKMLVEGYVDASFCAHEKDAKGHTGLIVCVGGVPVLCQSSKQKIVTKDSTESELVGASDKYLNIIQCQDFMNEQGYNGPAPRLMQDNTSTIRLITKGGGKYRTKYLRVRQATIHDQIKDSSIMVKFVSTGNMIADLLSKPLQGTLFRGLVKCVLKGKQHHHRGTDDIAVNNM